VKREQSLRIKLMVTVIIVRICSLLQWVACWIASVRHFHNDLNLSRYFRRIFTISGVLSVCHFKDRKWVCAFVKEVTKNIWPLRKIKWQIYVIHAGNMMQTSRRVVGGVTWKW
jgi:hypothetical protein